MVNGSGNPNAFLDIFAEIYQVGVLGLLHRVVGVLHSVVGVLHRVLGVLHRVVGVFHRVLGVRVICVLS